jgi:hypothetical protein
MPRTKKTETENLAPAEPTKRRTAAPKSTAVNHKHTTKTIKTLAPTEIPVRIFTQEEIAKLAYSYWEARGCQGGSAQNDWFQAEQELKSRAAVN